MRNKTKRHLIWGIAGLSLLVCSCNKSNTVTDADGNSYPTVKIGKQIWMAENLRVTHYQNGNPIYQVTDNTKWSKVTDGAYCSYKNDSVNIKKYGLLYNWYAISDSRNLAPEGWHIPTAAEVAELVNYLKGDTIAAGKMKLTGTKDWLSPNIGATNESGFSALPGGYRLGTDGSFHTLGSNGYWWTATQSFEMFSWSPRIYQAFADTQRESYYMSYGFSVRCVKD